MKEIYNKRLEDYKGEFNNNKPGGHSKLKCFASYLWEKNEKEILKKFILQEAYEETVPGKPDFGSLDVNSSLMKAMQQAFRGSEYPNAANLPLTDNEKSRLS